LDEKFKVGRPVVEAIISGITLFHVILLIEYYRMQTKLESRSWFEVDSPTWRGNKAVNFFTELIIILPHPFPGVQVPPGRYLSVLMFLRMYSIFRVIRNSCAAYQERFLIKSNKAFRTSGAIEFNWAFAARNIFRTHPWACMLALTVYNVCTFAYIMYVWERITDPAVRVPWTMRTAVWNTVITMGTIGYGDTYAWTQEGRLTACFMALTGIVLASLLIFVIMNVLVPTTAERHAVTIHEARYLNHRANWVAVLYIQLWWRRALFLRRRAGHNAMPKYFHWRNIAIKSEFREIRRSLTLLEMEAVSAVDELELHTSNPEEEAQKPESVAGVIAEGHAELRDNLVALAKSQAQALKLLGAKPPKPLVFAAHLKAEQAKAEAEEAAKKGKHGVKSRGKMESTEDDYDEYDPYHHEEHDEYDEHDEEEHEGYGYYDESY
jgi:hypothetical protein